MAELTKRQPLPVLKEWVRACVEEGRNLTPWEVDFVSDLYEQLNEYGRLSVK